MKGDVGWVDERGSRVIIHSFFSKVYIDSEMVRLDREYKIWECDGNSRCSTLGSANKECFAAQILSLVRAVYYNPPTLVGVKKEELEKVTETPYYVIKFIAEGFLREKWIAGDLVVFPTEKLLENQKISKIG